MGEQVFMLMNKIGRDPSYWHPIEDADPIRERILRGVPWPGNGSCFGEFGVTVLPVGWMPGRFFVLAMATRGGKTDWFDVGRFVEHNMERGIAECPEAERNRFRTMAELALNPRRPTYYVIDRIAGKVLLGATTSLQYAQQIAHGAMDSRAARTETPPDPRAVLVVQLVSNAEGKRL